MKPSTSASRRVFVNPSPSRRNRKTPFRPEIFSFAHTPILVYKTILCFTCIIFIYILRCNTYIHIRCRHPFSIVNFVGIYGPYAQEGVVVGVSTTTVFNESGRGETLVDTKRLFLVLCILYMCV